MQVFLTSSSTLREQVAVTFRKMHAAVVGMSEAARRASLSAREYATLSNVPSEAFPLFLTPG